MSVANDTREKVKKTIQETRDKPLPQEKGRGEAPVVGATPNTQDQTTLRVNEGPSSIQTNEETSLRVNNNENFSVNDADFLLNKTPEEIEEHMRDHVTVPCDIPPTAQKNTGKIKKDEDEKETDREHKPLEIQEGDIINYMMKDIILKFANWAGGYVCDWVGEGLYRGCSYVYHKAVEPTADTVISGIKNFPKNVSTVLGCGKNDDQTTLFTKAVGYRQLKNEKELHKKQKTNQKNFNTLLSRALIGRLDGEIQLETEDGPKTFKSLNEANIPDNIQKHLRAFQELAKTKNQNQILEMGNQIPMIAESMATMITQEKLFTQNYAAAMVIHNKQKDKNYLNIADARNMTDDEKARTARETELYKAEAKKLFYATYGRYKNPQTEEDRKLKEKYPDWNDFIKESNKALETAHSNTKNGKYNEKGIQPENKALDTLNGMLYPSRQSEREPRTLGSAIDNDKMPDSSKVKDEIEALNADKEKNDQRRKNFDNRKPKDKSRGTNPSHREGPTVGPRIDEGR